MDKYYWHGKSTLYEEISNVIGLKKVSIATAYISCDGVKIIQDIKDKYKLKKEQIRVFISSEFSSDKPHVLLEKLRQICIIYIIFQPKLHSKVFMLKSNNECKIIFGSANLTKGGFESNIEFDVIKKINNDEEDKLNIFFDYCFNNATVVDDRLIEIYKNNYEAFEQYRKDSNNIKKLFNQYINKDNIFDENSYDLSNMYFNFDDYETLFPKNESLKDSNIMYRRKIIQNKMLAIHDSIIKKIKKKGIYPHWNKQNITSAIIPMEFNRFKVNWLGVRYGKSHDFIKYISESIEDKADEFSFPKHACIQYNLTPEGFEINLFHAVRHKAIDRGFLHGGIIDEKSVEIVNAIRKLKGKGYRWIINREGSISFNIDTEKSEKFIDFYKNNDEDGYESYLCYFIVPNDTRLKDIESISELILDKIDEILALYWLLSWNGKIR